MQGIEIHCGVPICYGLGNFLFDPEEGEFQYRATNFYHVRHEEQLTGGVFIFDFNGKDFRRLTIAPVVLPLASSAGNDEPYINWPSQPVAQRTLERLKRISDDLGGDFSEKLNAQLWATRRREISLRINLIVKGHEYYRIWHLIKLLKVKHIASLFRHLLDKVVKKIKTGGGRE